MKRDIKLQLISNKIAKVVAENVEDLKIEFDAENAAAQEAVAMIGEIQNIIAFSELNDFDMIEEIMKIFDEYGFYTGNCHDF